MPSQARVIRLKYFFLKVSCFRKLKSFFKVGDCEFRVYYLANVVLFQMFTKIQMDYPLTLMEVEINFVNPETSGLTKLLERTAGNTITKKTPTIRYYLKKFQTKPKRTIKSR